MLITPFPDTFISDLGGTYGGTILSIATALAASALLVFACNTAIIGAYHVFLALSRMGYLPKFITATNTGRGTPHNAILLATSIPVVVLIGVRGQIDILGDLYAFGLLGAFSLTCLAMSVIRYRELRGGSHVSAAEAAERFVRTINTSPNMAWHTRLSNAVAIRMNDQIAARLHNASERLSPWAQRAGKAWPTLKFYLGIVTTLLVGIAWITNLFSKPLATVFGGGFSVVGIAVAILYHQRLVAQGEAPVVPMQRLQRMADSLIVALSSASDYNRQVIDAAIATAETHQLVFLYLSRKPAQSPSFMQFADPYLTDLEAQRTLTYAQNQAKHARLKASFIYRLGGAGQVIDIWRITRPDEIIAEAEIAKKVSKYVPPDYVRYQQLDGVRVAHYVRHNSPGERLTPPIGPGGGIVVGGETLGGEAGSPPREQPAREQRGPKSEAPPSPRRPRPSAAVPPLETPGSEGGGVTSADEENWIWTGTDLVRKSTSEKEPPES